MHCLLLFCSNKCTNSILIYIEYNPYDKYDLSHKALNILNVFEYTECIEYTQMNPNLYYEYYEIMYNLPFPDKWIRETISYILSFSIFYL